MILTSALDRPLRDGLFDIGRDWDPFFAQMSVFGRDHFGFGIEKSCRVLLVYFVFSVFVFMIFLESFLALPDMLPYSFG
jgi:hypothetical protein